MHTHPDPKRIFYSTYRVLDFVGRKVPTNLKDFSGIYDVKPLLLTEESTYKMAKLSVLGLVCPPIISDASTKGALGCGFSKHYLFKHSSYAMLCHDLQILSVDEFEIFLLKVIVGNIDEVTFLNDVLVRVGLALAH